ncbi:hypothetical protein AMS68_005313 [Peltaster fructicola]|uniref:Acyltransferase 3 domain-containing protein n=1 Tax=Peltaster fructicola TaxID=286661 RepID=A0A6H0XYP2_9PEZI|nr:hypothetical protein AMS68_005313 [Peltaster fructicola]
MGILLGDDSPKAQSSVSRITDFFVPEIFTRGRVATPHLGPTAWLDGLRGWAALCVTFMHLTVYTHDGIELCYGSKFRHNEEYNTTWAALPIIRLPFTGGHFSVMLFFVISGYVVPRRLIQYLQEGRRQDFTDAVHSAIVRRPVRLYVPVFLCTIAIFTCWHVLGITPENTPKQGNIVSEVFAWIAETTLFSYFYRNYWLFSYYNVHTWTIPVELRGSMFLFVYLIIVQGLSNRNRILMTAGMIIHLAVLSPGAWYACFFAGMFICELDLLALSGNNIRMPWSIISDWLYSKSRASVKTVVMHALFIASLYLATQPSSDWSTKAETLGNCPGWSTLSAMVPFYYIDADSQFRWFWLFWAAALLLFSIREISWLRRSFDSPIAQYLGRHSFALYLIHGPMIAYFSESLFFMTGVKEIYEEKQRPKFGAIAGLLSDQPWWPLPKGGPAGLEPNFLFCAFVSIPVYLYVAELGTKMFDRPSIKISQAIWQRFKYN